LRELPLPRVGFFRLCQQLLSQLALIHLVCHGIEFLTSSILAAKLTPGASNQDQIHRCSEPSPLELSAVIAGRIRFAVAV
jgi:hypothetical protein